jgi:hypothetical protein
MPNGKSQFSRVVTVDGALPQLWSVHRTNEWFTCKLWELTVEQFSALADYSPTGPRLEFLDNPKYVREFSPTGRAINFFARSSGLDLTQQAVEFFSRIEADAESPPDATNQP